MDIYLTLKKVAQLTSKALGGTNRDRPPEREPIQHEIKSGLFKNRPHVRRKKMRKFLSKAPERVPGAGKLSREERELLPEKVYPKKRYGTYITIPEFKKGLRHLKKAKRRVTEPSERAKMRTEIKLLEDLVPEEDEK